MRTTLKLDDMLLARDKSLTGHDDVAALVHEALTALVSSARAHDGWRFWVVLSPI